MNSAFEECYEIFDDVMEDYAQMRHDGYDDFDSYDGYIPGGYPNEYDSIEADMLRQYDAIAQQQKEQAAAPEADAPCVDRATSAAPMADIDRATSAVPMADIDRATSAVPEADASPVDSTPVPDVTDSIHRDSPADVTQEIARAFDQAAPPLSQPAESCEEDGYGEEDLLTLYHTNELMNIDFPQRSFIVDTLLSPGLTVLAGSPKVGKSWLVLQLCLRVARGERFLERNTTPGHVLYFALEDTPERIKKRIIRMGEDGSDYLHVATACAPLGRKLQWQIEQVVRRYPALRLIVIDTFQKIRPLRREMSYANDYTEVSDLKQLADALGVCILLVHHTRKLADNDYMNEISGTNGIAGSADTLMVLKKDARSGSAATLSCTGRDISDREIGLSLNRKTCVWELKSDSYDKDAFGDDAPPDELVELVAYMKEIKEFCGTNTEFAEGFCSSRAVSMQPNVLKRMMNRYRIELQDAGVIFDSRRVDGSRVLGVLYRGSE